MKKVLFCFTAMLLAVVIALPISGSATSHTLVSQSVVLMDADTGEVLFSKNRNKQMYPASITKVLTGLLVMEACSSTETATASEAAVKLPAGYAHIGLTMGDTIQVHDAMYAMMLPSANDAANVLAEHVAGTTASFSALMNQRAKEIGAHNSSFTNPSGIPDKNHYTSAYDMALITREAIKNPSFNSYFGATSHMLPAVNGSTKAKELTAYNYMLLSDKREYYADAVGGKIGYTGQAGHTMVTVAKRNGRTLICVVMGSNRDGKYADTKHVLNYGFNQL